VPVRRDRCLLAGRSVRARLGPCPVRLLGAGLFAAAEILPQGGGRTGMPRCLLRDLPIARPLVRMILSIVQIARPQLACSKNSAPTVARACACCRRIAPMASCRPRPHSSGVEHSLGKGEVQSSNLCVGTSFALGFLSIWGLLGAPAGKTGAFLCHSSSSLEEIFARTR
jgi:hypothetical protein